MTVNPELLKLVDSLDKGAHDNRFDGMCLLEAVAYVAGEEHSDRPACVCPILAAYGRTLNDAMPDTYRIKLLPLIPLLVGSLSTPEVERKRWYLLADRAVRVFAPAALRVAGLEEEAKKLESLDPITNEDAAADAADAARAAYAAAGAARAAYARAAYAAADAADAAYAAYAAADAAARAAADAADAAYAAYAAYAAADAARAAAYAAADAADAARAAYAAARAAADAAESIWDNAVQAFYDALAITE